MNIDGLLSKHQLRQELRCLRDELRVAPSTALLRRIRSVRYALYHKGN